MLPLDNDDDDASLMLPLDDDHDASLMLPLDDGSPPWTTEWIMPGFLDPDPVSSLHTRPLPVSSNKSYTLENAISPLPPPPPPSPPPMHSLRPPSPKPPAPLPRPRGRPRKPQPRLQPPSPPPPVHYPYPQFSPPSPPPPPTPGQAIFKLNMATEAHSAPHPIDHEKKKPIMACLFCRERKIACGPPPPGGPQRCNQCTRRGLVCEYPKESRRGQHKRGARAARVEALAAGSSSATKSKSKPKPSSTTPDPSSSSQPAPSDTDTTPCPAPSSPLTPLPPSPSLHYHQLPSTPHPAHSIPVHAIIERKTRPEKVEIAIARASSLASRTPPKELPWEAARRAVQRQHLHKRFLSPDGAIVAVVGAHQPAGERHHEPELAMVGLHMAMGP